MDSHNRTFSDAATPPRALATYLKACASCGTPFRVFPADVRRGRDPQHCSRTCRDAAIRSPERVAEQFWLRVDKSTPDVCWEWQGQRWRHGYGMFSVGGNQFRERAFAHRVAFSLTNGPIPDGLWVLHRCDNPPCVNPAHLFLGVAQDNSTDMVRKRRHKYGERNHNHKLTDAQVVSIRARYAQGSISQKQLGSEYGVSETTIHVIVTGKGWRLA